MNQPELFDIVELLVDLPDENLSIGTHGTIVESYRDNNYEVEFSNSIGETIALCTLSSNQFIVVWQAQTKRWLSLTEQLTDVMNKLDTQHQKKVLQFALSLKN